MLTVRDYLSTAVDRRSWEEKTDRPFETHENARSVIGPEDFVSILAVVFSIIIFFIVIIYADIDGRYPLIKHLQFISPTFFLAVLGMVKVRIYERGRSRREVNLISICQCFILWVHGATLLLYLMNAFA